MGLFQEETEEGALKSALGFLGVFVLAVGQAVQGYPLWGLLAVVVGARSAMAAYRWYSLRSRRERAASVGTGRFPGAERGYDPAAVDGLWARIEVTSVEELRGAEFPITEPGYEANAVRRALESRIHERGSGPRPPTDG